MRFSKYFIPTLKEEPSEAEIISHSLCIRAGLIRKAASGIYSFLPLGFKVLKKIENIVREEMNDAGAIELLMPVVQPAEIWQQSERWYEYGPEMFRLKDRNEREFCLGPTHEELFTSISGSEIKSYKELPINIYQIQVKFRDEIRPRYGLLRAREFIMKDAYSFGSNDDELNADYEKMYSAYCKIIERLGLRYKVVEADTGLIGGKFSHEFMVLAENGEEIITYCQSCGYAANIDNAKFLPKKSSEESLKLKDIEEVYTPGIKTIEDLCMFLKEEKENIGKIVAAIDSDNNLYAILMSGERTLNISKTEKYLKKQINLITENDDTSNLALGFIGPVGLDKKIRLLVDYSIEGKSNFTAGANKKDYHFKNVNLKRDFDTADWGSFSYAAEGDLCKKCGSVLKFEKGIEVGHIFKLGTKYSEKLNAKFLDRDGKLKPYKMGCYGIGVSRILSAAIEQSHDLKGIVWPESISPFKVIIITTNVSDKNITDAAESAYALLLNNNIEVLYDDRNISAGIKFKDADLIGITIKMVFGKSFIESGLVEIEHRKDGQKESIKYDDLKIFIEKLKDKTNG